MERIKVMLIGHSDSRLYEIKQQLANNSLAIVGVARLDDHAIEKISSLRPNIVILQCDYDYSETINLAGDTYAQGLGCGVILICDKTDMKMIETAMLAGVRRVFKHPADTDELIDIIRTSHQLEMARLQSTKSVNANMQSKVVTVFGSKGGIGKTTIAVNLAVMLSQMGKKIAIIDADLQFGDVNAYFDIESKNTIAEISQGKDASDINAIKRMLVMHHSGVSILCAPNSPEYAEYVSAKNIEAIITAMRPYYDYIIIDTSPYFSESTVVAIENADLILLITGIDISSLRNTKTSMNIFDSLRQSDKLELVINKAAKGIITVKDVHQLLERTASNIVSFDNKTALNSHNRGIPIVLGYPRTEIARELRQLSQNVLKRLETQS
ncbi:MAG: AAA family ATPase [Christensenellales bacterium]|jgi:pilus assembly protein CpaE